MSRNQLLRIAVSAVLLLAVLVSLWLKFRPSTHERHRQANHEIIASDTSTLDSDQLRGVEPAGDSTPQSSVDAPRRKVDKWKTVTKTAGVPLFTFRGDSLRATDAAVALLELNAEQAQKFNESLTKFLNQLRSAELANAYVSVDAKGNEQIVVAAFDRSKIIAALRAELGDRLGSAVADFMIEIIPFSATIAAGNSEIRTFIERAPDGSDREVFECITALTPVKLPTGHMSPDWQRETIRRPLVDGVQTRAKHLFAAIDQMPRRQETSVPQPGTRRSPGTQK